MDPHILNTRSGPGWRRWWRRIGAPLLTPIIGEGFGSQDTNERQRLVEVINSIQDDFEKILVITDINEMKGFFPVRIQVTKVPNGSKVEVVEEVDRR